MLGLGIFEKCAKYGHRQKKRQSSWRQKKSGLQGCRISDSCEQLSQVWWLRKVEFESLNLTLGKRNLHIARVFNALLCSLVHSFTIIVEIMFCMHCTLKVVVIMVAWSKIISPGFGTSSSCNWFFFKVPTSQPILMQKYDEGNSLEHSFCVMVPNFFICRHKIYP